MKRSYAIYDNWTVWFYQPTWRDEVHIIKEKRGQGETGRKDVWVPRSTLIKYVLEELKPELGSLLVKQIRDSQGFTN